MADIFQHLNELNTGMQGHNENFLTSTNKRISFEGTPLATMCEKYSP